MGAPFAFESFPIKSKTLPENDNHENCEDSGADELGQILDRPHGFRHQFGLRVHVGNRFLEIPDEAGIFVFVITENSLHHENLQEDEKSKGNKKSK
jgi:hypothetical protein